MLSITVDALRSWMHCAQVVRHSLLGCVQARCALQRCDARLRQDHLDAAAASEKAEGAAVRPEGEAARCDDVGVPERGDFHRL